MRRKMQILRFIKYNLIYLYVLKIKIKTSLNFTYKFGSRLKYVHISFTPLGRLLYTK